MMPRRSPTTLRPLEIEVLDVTLRLEERGGPAHGYAVRKSLVRTIADGTIYRALLRLEEGGLVESSWEAAEEAERERRPRRRCYSVTAAGARALVEARRDATSAGEWAPA